MARYIDAGKLKQQIQEEPTDGMFTNEILEVIDEQPDADVSSNKYAKWKFDDPCDGIVYCTRCGYHTVAYEFPHNTVLTVQGLREIFRDVHRYCTKCGAKMNGQEHKGEVE